MPEKLRLIRALATVVGAMNLVFMIFDYRVSGGIWSTTLSVRALLEGVVVLGLLSTWSPHIGRWLDDLTSVLILSIGGSISVMLYHSSAHDIARETYYAALLLVVFGLCSIVPLSRRRLLVLSVLLIGSYGLAATHHPAAVLLVQLFLMVCCAVLGIAARETRERYAQENFRLRYLLEQDARRKDEEVERIAHLAEHDALTGLPNRTRFYRETQSLLQDAARHRQKLAILFIDLDGFKPINDSHGHAAGDRMLVTIAERLRRTLRAEDRLARIGGDEFVVAALIHDKRPSSLPAITRHLAEQIARPVPLREGSASVTASIGLALFPEDGRTLNELLTRADEDMYRVKGSTALRPSPLGIVGTP